MICGPSVFFDFLSLLIKMSRLDEAKSFNFRHFRYFRQHPVLPYSFFLSFFLFPLLSFLPLFLFPSLFISFSMCSLLSLFLSFSMCSLLSLCVPFSLYVFPSFSLSPFFFLLVFTSPSILLFPKFLYFFLVKYFV